MKITSYLTALIIAIFCFSSCQQGASVEETNKDAKTEKTTKKVSGTDVLKIGDVAPDFNLKNIDGSMVSLASLDGAKGYIVTFTCNHCPYSVMYEDRLIALHTEMSALGYPVVAINPNDPEVQPKDSFDGMVERAKEKAFNFPYLFDDGQKVYPQYGATRTPHVFVLDNERKVRYIGAIDDSARDEDDVETEYVKKAIMAIEAGKDPDPNFTKAVGCTIKKKV